MTEKKSSLLRNLTLATIVSGAAIGAHFGFNAWYGTNPVSYDKPAVHEKAPIGPTNRKHETPEEDNSGKYYSMALAGLALVVGTALVATKVKKPFLAYTLLNDYLARRRQSKQE